MRRIGRPDVARDVIEALMLDRGLRRRFDAAVWQEARQARPSAATSPTAATCATCRRSRSTPRRARDFDDAISAEERDGGAAGACGCTSPTSARTCGRARALDREACRRATSVYVPGAVEPMLPEALSSDACSLVPREDRLAVTVELEGSRRAGRAQPRSTAR